MENKKIGIIIAVVAVVLFVGVAFIFMYEPAKNALMPTKTTQESNDNPEEITGGLPVLECNYDSDQGVFKDALDKKDINLCSCMVGEKSQDTCKSSVMDITLYDQAVQQLDESLCENIRGDIKKGACFSAVKGLVEQLEDEDPEYLARVYAASHNEKAIGELEKIIANDQENIDAYIILALVYAEKGLREQEQGKDQTPYVNKAFEAIESAKQIDDKNSEVYRAEGYVNEIKPDYDQALILYDKSIELDDSNILAHAGKGHALRMKGMFEDAVEELNKAAKLDIHNELVFIYTNLCNLEYLQLHREDAIRNCKIVTQIEETDPVFKSEAYQIMATMFMETGDIEQAKNYLLQAKKSTPDDPNLYVTLSKLNIYEQNYDQAQVNAQKARDLSSTKVASYLALSHALYMQEKFNESIQIAKEGILLLDADVSLLAPNKPTMESSLNYSIANSYRHLGDETKQKEYEQKAKDAFENSNTMTE